MSVAAGGRHPGRLRSSYHRVLSKRRWSTWRLARSLAHHVVERLVPEGPIAIVGDDTVTQHPGKHIYGKGRHRDAVRFTHSYTAWRWRHKWGALDPGLTTGTEPFLGLAGFVRVVPNSGGQLKAGAASQHIGRPQATTSLRAVALVSPAEIRACRRQWRWHACARTVRLGAAAADVDQQVRPGCQPVQSAAETKARHPRLAACEGSPAARTGSGRAAGKQPTTAVGLVVRRRSAGGGRRDGHGTQVQERCRSAGCSSKTG